MCDWQRTVSNGLHILLPHRDQSSALSKKYSENYERLAVKNLKESNIDRRFLKNQAINLVKYLDDVTGLTACDVGIGQGFLCDQLLRSGVKHVTAVDISPSYLMRFVGDEHVTPCLANAEYLPFKDMFDLLVSTDVMEHVLNVGSFLFSVNRALKIGGVIAIRVPYQEPLLCYSPHMRYGYDFGHLRSFDKVILKAYMEQAGFKIRSMKLDGFSLGAPQPWLYNTNRRKSFYHWLLKTMNKHLDHPADASLWNSRLARLVMRPAEIVVVAQKVSNIAIPAVKKLS